MIDEETSMKSKGAIRREIRICKCGRIHIFDEAKIDKALNEDKEFMLVCGSCGVAYRIGADREDGEMFGDPGKTYFNMYTIDVRDKTSITEASFTDGDHKPFAEIFYDEGISVPMMSGMSANDYGPHGFADNWFPDFLNELDRRDITVEEIREMREKWRKDRITVNMGWFIRQIGGDTATLLAKARIRGLDFTGTEYEKYQKE